ncbi:glutamyl-tRNA(Gln) amidotransferase subunit B, mitochondrial [Nomia melanderi]|uniref:glutamyl-tRNA(Gln) amidotransferase subunit B, mitochondrial n=1 Tax=Nomia melanderi TaxID=2448451 RepID=UPI0013046CFD|nr:glutamyl-tRNA(Gln) amidotransferase subunit B, mitochondrial [Nomia melanderi]XP_031828234.1 glutamyl-tRNA(Gln) amidotransferase subunit B, mitochondrial [Nomia melanderi]XP_031828235.1 glutamyl-tRNA(Gln) amidotransferase subunit B, mitochondrial [Nomia melanderi]XP_031828236.1 glutamyl-tRNA(Gln) amidotransferase subunit B, mitochondrial [Nomia melanderi]
MLTCKLKIVKMLLSRRSCIVRKYHKDIPKQCTNFTSKITETPPESVWTPTIGLEIHAQMATNSKLFSGAGTNFNSPINSSVSMFDCAIPGTMPVLNKKSVEMGILTALALSCQINPVSMFERKHYFYSDLPAGFQITQHKKPLATNGIISFMVFNPQISGNAYIKSSKIKQIQLEQDSGRSYHNEDLGMSLIDLNRAGLPLMELVFEPDLSTADEAAALIKELTLVLQSIGTCSCKMEEGALRVDANVSVSKNDASLGTRTEIKNIGNTHAVRNAVQYEIQRQINILNNGGEIVNETRAWDAIEKKTIIMREKEENHDYRFMPEPNLPLLRIHVDQNEENKYNLINASSLKKQLPELPHTLRNMMIAHDIKYPIIAAIMSSSEVLQLFLELTKRNKNCNQQLIAEVIISRLLGFIQHNDKDIKFLMDNIDFMDDLIDLLQQKLVNYNRLQSVLEIWIEQPELRPRQIVEQNNWFMISDPNELQKLCLDVIEKNPKIVAKYKRGKVKLFKRLIHEAVKVSNDCADMQKLTQIMTKLLRD